MSSLPCLHGGASNDAVLVCYGGDYDDDGSSGDEDSEVKPRDSGLLHQAEFFHYCKVFTILKIKDP